MNKEWEVIVEFGSAGGKVSLYGKRLKDNEWEFRLNTQEYALADFVDEEDYDLLSSETRSVGDWNEALRLMNKYPWYKMCPIKVHPLFKEFLWDKIEKLEEHVRNYGRWFELCCMPERKKQKDNGKLKSD